MPYRRAWWGMLALAPVIGLAFWPQYYGALGQASFAFHAHGITATFWLVFVGTQSFTAQARDRRMHRLSGRAVFVAAPLFAGAAVLVMHSMATKFATQSHPFYAFMGPRLGLHDVISTTVLVGFVCAALAMRRKIVLHAACMLSTVLLVLPPVIARLPLPRLWHMGELVVIGLALLIAWREPRGRTPFLVLAASQVVLIGLYETVGVSKVWEYGFARFSTWPVAPFAVAAMAATVAAMILAWRSVPARTAVRPAMA